MPKIGFAPIAECGVKVLDPEEIADMVKAGKARRGQTEEKKRRFWRVAGFGGAQMSVSVKIWNGLNNPSVKITDIEVAFTYAGEHRAVYTGKLLAKEEQSGKEGIRPEEYSLPVSSDYREVTLIQTAAWTNTGQQGVGSSDGETISSSAIFDLVSNYGGFLDGLGRLWRRMRGRESDGGLILRLRQQDRG